MKQTSLDAIDMRILCALQQNGPMSKAKLAEFVNLSATPCWARLDKLKAAGYIRGHHTEIALEKFGDFTQVVVPVALSHHRKADFDRFETHIQTVDEIIECMSTGGGMDYILKVICPSLVAFQALMENLLEQDIGIERYMTYIATRKIKATQPNLLKLADVGP